jgi:hypothetical protein
MVGTLVSFTNQFSIILAGAETNSSHQEEAEVKKLTTWLNDFPKKLGSQAGK